MDPETAWELSLCRVENARDIPAGAGDGIQAGLCPNLTLSRLREAAILPLCPDKGSSMTYDLSRAASTYLDDDIELLKRMRAPRKEERDELLPLWRPHLCAWISCRMKNRHDPGRRGRCSPFCPGAPFAGRETFPVTDSALLTEAGGIETLDANVSGRAIPRELEKAIRDGRVRAVNRLHPRWEELLKKCRRGQKVPG